MLAIPSVRSSCAVCRATYRGQVVRCPRDGSVLDPDAADPLPWTMLADRYLVGTLIADGGVGRVYRGRRMHDHAPVAIKVMFGEMALDVAHRGRFDREAAIGLRLRHPNLIGVLDDGESEGGLRWLVMELAQGRTLREAIQGDAMSTDEVRRIAAELAAGLAHAHAAGVIHRDLKPANIVLAPQARIVDLGTAIEEASRASPRLTRDGRVFATPEYAAPEVIRGALATPAADLWALGMILFEMLAGTRPFVGDPFDVARRNCLEPWPTIASLAPDRAHDPGLEALARWLLERKPADRPSSAQEVVAHLGDR